MDEISAYAAYGIDKIIKKLPKKAGVKKPSKLPYGTIFHHKKNLKLKQMQEAKSLKSADEKVKVNRAPIKGVIKPKSKIVNGGVATHTISKKKVNVIRSLIQEALNRKTKTVNGGVVKQTKAKNPAKNPIMSDESFSSDSEEESFSGDCEEESSGQDGTEYTLDEGSTSCSCSSVSSPESSPAAAAAAIPPASRRKTNKLNNGDLNNNNNKKNEKSPAVKQSTTQPKETEAEPPKKTQRKSMAAPSCPLLRIPKEATTVKSSPLTNKSAAEKRKSCPLPTKMAASTAAAAAAKSPTTVKQEPNVIKEKAKDVDVVMDSVEKGTSTLSWLIYPLKIDDFFTQYWENKACQVRRKRLNYHADLVSFKMIDEMLIDNHLEFSTNIDLTTYKNGKRDTLKVPGRAMPPIVWGHYGEGCSVRILNPSTYLPKLRQVCTDLQEYFHCLVGANIYLTPPNSQGFAPHYDDIEAFVLQVEGRKRWRLYVPPSPNDVLARTSSGNLKQQQLGTLIFDEVLEPGDLLYFPRGTVHQAVTEQKQHSLHITLSVYQQQSYANLVETLMPIVLENAIKNNLNLRHGLPLTTWSNLGLVNSDKKTPERTDLLKKTKSLVADYLMPTSSQIDNAIDQLATRFQHEALPPYISASDKKRTIFGSRNKTDRQGNSLCDYELSGQTKIRLLRKNIMRLVNQENCLRLYFYVDNALEYCKYEANFMEIVESEADAIKLLINSYPKYVSINKLPLQNVEQCIETATGMWERGLLMTEEPFPKT